MDNSALKVVVLSVLVHYIILYSTLTKRWNLGNVTERIEWNCHIRLRSYVQRKSKRNFQVLNSWRMISNWSLYI